MSPYSFPASARSEAHLLQAIGGQIPHPAHGIQTRTGKATFLILAIRLSQERGNGALRLGSVPRLRLEASSSNLVPFKCRRSLDRPNFLSRFCLEVSAASNSSNLT
jgi:hypothetical protein